MLSFLKDVTCEALEVLLAGEYGHLNISVAEAKDGTIYQAASIWRSTRYLYDGSSNQMYPAYFGIVTNFDSIGVEVVGAYDDQKNLGGVEASLGASGEELGRPATMPV